MFDLIPFRRKNTVSPLNSFNSFFDELEKNFWPEVFRESFWEGRFNSFRTDVSDNGSEFLIEAELPGFDKDQIDVEINGDILTISAGKDDFKEENKGNYIRKERRIGRVTRSFALDNVDVDAVKAEFRDGVLKLVLPKIQREDRNVKRIDIN